MVTVIGSWFSLFEISLFVIFQECPFGATAMRRGLYPTTTILCRSAASSTFCFSSMIVLPASSTTQLAPAALVFRLWWCRPWAHSARMSWSLLATFDERPSAAFTQRAGAFDHGVVPSRASTAITSRSRTAMDWPMSMELICLQISQPKADVVQLIFRGWRRVITPSVASWSAQ